MNARRTGFAITCSCAISVPPNGRDRFCESRIPHRESMNPWIVESLAAIQRFAETRFTVSDSRFTMRRDDRPNPECLGFPVQKQRNWNGLQRRWTGGQQKALTIPRHGIPGKRGAASVWLRANGKQWHWRATRHRTTGRLNPYRHAHETAVQCDIKHLCSTTWPANLRTAAGRELPTLVGLGRRAWTRERPHPDFESS